MPSLVGTAVFHVKGRQAGDLTMCQVRASLIEMAPLGMRSCVGG
jgi:hypothetical protein